MQAPVATSKAITEPVIVADSDQPQKVIESSPEALRKLARKESADLGTAVKTITHPRPQALALTSPPCRLRRTLTAASAHHNTAARHPDPNPHT